MSTLITKAPFKDIELVPLSARRSNKETFDQRVQLHNFLCQDSGTIKLCNMTADFWESIKLDLRNNAQVSEHIIDIAEVASTIKDGTLYIQCLTLHHDTIIQCVQDYIVWYTSENPGEDIPEVLTRKTHAADTSVLESLTVNTWTT